MMILPMLSTITEVFVLLNVVVQEDATGSQVSVRSASKENIKDNTDQVPFLACHSKHCRAPGKRGNEFKFKIIFVISQQKHRLLPLIRPVSVRHF